MSLTSPTRKVKSSWQGRGWLQRPTAEPMDAPMLMNQVAQFCRKAFEQGGAGKVLAAELGLHDRALLERFMVGYADDALLEAVPKAKGAIRSVLIGLGLIAEDGSLAIAGSLVIPVLDREGKATGFVAIDPQDKETSFPAGLPLYGLNSIALGGRQVVATDSVLTALLCVQAGVTDVVALGEIPGEAEEAFLRLNRPQKAYCDTRGQGIPLALQRLEIPCYRLKVERPFSREQLDEALSSAEPLEVHLRAGNHAAAGLASLNDAVAVVLDDGLHFRCGDREYELCDLDAGESGRMRVRLKALHNGRFHLDTLDLYAARSRAAFAKAAAALHDVPPEAIEADVCLMIGKLESVRSADRASGKRRAVKGSGYAMTGDEEAEALDHLKAPDLLDRIVRDLGRLGYVGEENNKRLGYLIATSRKLQNPICGAVMSRAGAGKSRLMDVLAEIVPPEDLVRFTRITPQALYYAEPGGLKNKLVISGEDEGLVGSDYALRELISSQKIRLAVPISDPETGKLRTVECEVEGPIALLFSTTKPAVHFENATRLMSLSLDESSEQTEGIHQAQRLKRTLEGLEGKTDLDDLRRLHQNVQRLLKPLFVVNTYAPHLQFPTQPLEMRREHEKYLSLIDVLTLLHQRQRAVKSAVINGREIEYVEVAIEDIEQANRLMSEVLGAGRGELTRPSRDLLGHIKRMVEEKAAADGIQPALVRFNRRDIREFTGWSDSQIKSHIKLLEELEYLLVGRSERGKTFRYELVNDGTVKRLSGLTDIAKLRALKARGKVEKSGVVLHGLADCEQQENVEISKATRKKSRKVCLIPESPPVSQQSREEASHA